MINLINVLRLIGLIVVKVLQNISRLHWSFHTTIVKNKTTQAAGKELFGWCHFTQKIQSVNVFHPHVDSNLLSSVQHTHPKILKTMLVNFSHAITSNGD